MPNFGGARVLALESRRAAEIATLIRTAGGEPMLAPAVREASADPAAVLAFAAALERGEFDWVIFLTGTGVRMLAAEVPDREGLLNGLRRIKIAARGPKPAAVLRELQIPIAANAPEPSTWRELIAALDATAGITLNGARVAVQEHGADSPELTAALESRGVRVTPVAVYRWALPENLEPLRAAVRALAAGEIGVVLFTSAVQIAHLFQIAEEQDGGAAALARTLRQTVVAAIGPTTLAELERCGFAADVVPEHPRMGFLVHAAAEYLQKRRER